MPETKLFAVSWSDDRTEYVVVAEDEAQAVRRFIASRGAAGAGDAMRAEAEEAGQQVELLVQVGRLVSEHGHEVYEMTPER